MIWSLGHALRPNSGLLLALTLEITFGRFQGPFGTPRIESWSGTFKENAPSALLSLQPLGIILGRVSTAQIRPSLASRIS